MCFFNSLLLFVDIIFYLCVHKNFHRTQLCPVFFYLFFNIKPVLTFSFLHISTVKTDMPVSEVPIPKNGILALARGSHLRRVFPVPRDYRRQSNTVPITGSEVQPKWSNPSVCPHACGLVLHVWSSPFRQKPKEGFHYAKQ